MQRYLEHIVFFVILVLLQALLFNNLTFSPYLTPLVYVAFIVLMPLNVKPLALLLWGFAIGLAMDFFMGTGGLNTIASLATAFLRPSVYGMAVGKDVVLRENAMPTSKELGRGKYIYYSSVLIMAHCTIFFVFETLSLHNILYTLLRIAFSGAATILLVWFAGYVYPDRNSSHY